MTAPRAPGQAKDVMAPGSRGGKWYRAKTTGLVRYGTPPAGELHEEIDPTTMPSGHRVSFVDAKGSTHEGYAVAWHKEGASVTGVDGDPDQTEAVRHEQIKSVHAPGSQKAQYAPEHMQVGHTVRFMGADQEKRTGTVRSWGHLGATVDTEHGSFAVPFHQMDNVEKGAPAPYAMSSNGVIERGPAQFDAIPLRAITAQHIQPGSEVTFEHEGKPITGIPRQRPRHVA